MAGSGWRMEAIVQELAECTLALGHVTQDGRVGPGEDRTVCEVAGALIEVMPQLQQALLIEKATTYLRRHNTLVLPAEFWQEQKQINEVLVKKKSLDSGCNTLKAA